MENSYLNPMAMACKLISEPEMEDFLMKLRSDDRSELTIDENEAIQIIQYVISHQHNLRSLIKAYKPEESIISSLQKGDIIELFDSLKKHCSKREQLFAILCYFSKNDIPYRRPSDPSKGTEGTHN